MNILDEFDVSRFKLGNLCSRGHKRYGENKSLRRIDTGACVACMNVTDDRKREQYKKNNVCSMCDGRTEKHLTRRVVNGERIRICSDCIKTLTTKQCTKCKQEKHVDCFSTDKRKKDGKRANCKECLNKQRLEQRRKKGITPPIKLTEADILQSFIGKIPGAETVDASKFYLGTMCNKGHNWHDTGYTLRFKSNSHCKRCEANRQKENGAKYSDLRKYYQWLKSPRISPSVALLVEFQQFELNKKTKKKNKKEKHEKSFRSRQNYSTFEEKEKMYNKIYSHTRFDIGANQRLRSFRQFILSDGTVSWEKMEAMVSSASECPYCLAPISPLTASIDHIIPLSIGGKHSMQNLVCCCLDCNTRKNSMVFTRWIESLSTQKEYDSSVSLYVKRYGVNPWEDTRILQPALPLGGV